MAAKNEMKFLTGLRKDFKRHGFHYYKIPDTPVSVRFQIAKPFDCYISVDGQLGGMEAKYMDTEKSKSVKFKDLRETQHKGLREIIKDGGQGWVFYQIKFGRELRLYFWEYQDFERLCNKLAHGGGQNIPIKHLDDMRYIIGKKNRFDVLEYELGAFKDQWEIIGDLYE